MLNSLYQIVIYPIQLFIESIFTVFYRNTNNVILSIFFVSAVVNLICLPLYLKSEKIQDEEREFQKKLAPKVKKIRENFKGDERHMMIQTYYRQSHYHPAMKLRSSLSLLIQIPFFLGAYFFFSHLPLLETVGYGSIVSLMQPDALLNIYGVKINFLPILMTIINLISGYLYSKNTSHNDKLQLYLTSLVFLILLYNSPSGLVLYWIFNNLFSLIKNIASNQKEPIRILYCCFFSIVLMYFATTSSIFANSSLKITMLFVISQIAPYIIFLGLLFILLKFFNVFYDKYLKNIQDNKKTFMFAVISIWVIAGIIIPFSVVATAPEEFSFLGAFNSPFQLLSLTALRVFGIFVFWPVYMYFLCPEKYKPMISIVASSVFFAAVINTLTFQGHFGTLNTFFQFETLQTHNFMGSPISQIINALLMILVSFIAYIIFKRKKLQYIINLAVVIMVSGICLSVINGIKIQKSFIELKKVKASQTKTFEKVISLSKTGKNVIIIFLDRAISSYLPFILDGNPNLKNTFSGFRYYPNTLSLAEYTYLAYPAMAGGYEYSVPNLNKRNQEFMADKYNESISVMPTLFRNHGYKTIVTDAPWGNKLAKLKGVTYRNIVGRYSSYICVDKEFQRKTVNIIENNLVFYSLFVISPLSWKKNIYNKGNYYNSVMLFAPPKEPLDNYSALKFLPEITNGNSPKNSFVFINNFLPHFKTDLEYPDYPYKSKHKNIDKPFYGEYYSNSVSLILVAKYLQYLKDNNLYDNSRIIIVADHGHYTVTNPKFSDFQNKYVMPFNPLLMLKDYNAKGGLKTDNQFMTNADVPYIATKDIINNPTNPFTKNPIETSLKNKSVYLYWDTNFWNPDHYDGKTTTIKQVPYIGVKDNIFQDTNWKIPPSLN